MTGHEIDPEPSMEDEPSIEPESSIDDVERVTAALVAEVAARDTVSAVRSRTWPSVGEIADHTGSVLFWAAAILRSGEATSRRPFSRADGETAAEWLSRGRDDVLRALREVNPDRACWTLTSPEGTAAFWARRMRFETVRHLWDVRASGGARPAPPAELSTTAWADGIDEHGQVALARLPETLPALPNAVQLIATDTDRRWMLTPEWRLVPAVDDGAGHPSVTASAGELALFLWERADPRREPDRFSVDGADEVIAAYTSVLAGL